MKDKKSVVSFVRVSTEEQATHGAGLQAQIAANEKTALTYGLTIVKTFTLSDVSGTQVRGTPEMRQLMSLMESGSLHGVVVKELSRLLRPENFDLSLLHHFVVTNTLLYLPDGPHDLATDSGYLLTGMMSVIGGFERRQIVGRMMAGKEVKRKEGKFVSGTLPLGCDYDYKTSKWSWNADAVRVAAAYDLVLNTNTPYAEIARRCGIKRTSLRHTLLNPIYTGVRVYDSKRDMRPSAYKPSPNGRQGSRKMMKRAEEDIIRVKVLEPLVSPQVWNSVQKILSKRALAVAQVRNENGPRYLLNGFMVCGECGQPMYSHSNRKADYYYCKSNSPRAKQRGKERCPTSYILARKIEAKVEELLSERLQERAFLTRIAEEYLKRAAALTPIPELDIDGRMKKLERKRTAILDTFFEEKISKDERDTALATVNQELGQLLSLKPHSPALQPVQQAQRLGTMFRCLRTFKRLNRDKKRLLLKGMQAQIEVSGYEIKGLTVAENRPEKADSNNDNHLPAAGASLPERCAEIPVARQERGHRYAKAKLLPDAE
jgi:DNA invertase Pin-like site-specific DNA recombinase